MYWSVVFTVLKHVGTGVCALMYGSSKLTTHCCEMIGLNTSEEVLHVIF